MITSSYCLTATERVLPRLALDFTTASLDSRITFTRTGNTATVTNSSGNIVGINANLPRFDYDPTTLVCKGLLIEEARTNVLVNSLIDGTNLTTQIVTTTATAYTLSFYGTGNIVLSGTSSSTQTGTGAYPSRKTFTFTPTAGALTLTVSGTVQYAQLEVGAFATSFIPTTTPVTRNADVATMTGTNFSSWYNASEGAFFGQALLGVAAQLPAIATARAATSDAISFGFFGASQLTTQIWVGGANQLNIGSSGIDNAVNRVCFTYKLNNSATATNGASLQTDTSCLIPTVNALYIGQNRVTTTSCIHIQKISYYPQRLTNNEVLAFSKV